MGEVIKNHFSLRTVILGIGIAALALGLSWYIAFQARFLIAGPTIMLTEEPLSPRHERTVEVSGIAKNITELTLNDRAIFTDDQGYFSETLVLPEGYTIMTLRAEDRYGRQTALYRSFVYDPHI